MGLMLRTTKWLRVITESADVIALITCEFLRPDRDKPVPMMTPSFVAFRGVGTGPAERLAAADRYGAVLYGKRP